MPTAHAKSFSCLEPRVRETAGTPCALTIRGVFQALFFDFVRILPDDLARARIDQLEAVENVVAGALGRARREATQLAGEKVVRALELRHVRIAARGDLSRALEIPFALQCVHAIA